MFTATVTSQGQITFPSAMRKQADIKSGDKVIFTPKSTGNGDYEMTKVGSWESLRGILKKYSKVRRYPTQDDIAKAWASGYKKKWLANEKSPR